MDIQDQSVSKLSGLAGLLGSALLLGVFAFLSVFVGLETLDAQAALERYPEIRWARIIENTAYLFALALWALHSVGLFAVLRADSPGISLAAVVMSVLGLAILAAGAIPHTAETVISDLYHAPETAAELMPVLIVAWEVSLGWIDTFVVTGIVLTPVGLLLYGIAILRAPHFGSWTGWASILFAIAGIYAAVAGLIEESDIVGVGIFALVFFHIVIGWASFRLSAH
ncbi:hypothetical protein MUY35_00990 [Aliiroseovarius sp. S1339]|uniref:hypothetical protein n=1 Tax=Aliiroseovarius sp. S1339 TaxID=2936990 RepID=UPI0020BF9F80|nr:hypothetical protein [Aliiroseovarius sp. S1339]MCK8462421.1 hypothetical protein [Aliiroseovarius sp. S1339]